MNNRIVTSLCVLCAILCAVQRGSAQGSLTPPGTPAPTMLTLSQIEPRTPITNATAVTISASGSYYLTANISVTNGSAITITASQVTLDLNGFTISSTSAGATGTGIFLAGQGGIGNSDITILNGHIRGGFVNGIYFDINSAFPQNVRVASVSVSGCQNQGIDVNTQATVIEFCTVSNVGGDGIAAASVSHSAAYQCGTSGIHANTAENCYGNCSGSGYGLLVGTANNCQGVSNGSGSGLSATTANNCQGQSGSGTGLNANNIAIGCYGSSSGGTGLVAFIANSCSGSGTPNYTVVNKYNMP